MGLTAFLASSYQQYKEDTNAFTTWLTQAARSCGWKANRPMPEESSPAPPEVTAPSQRLKGRARKLAKQSNIAKPAEPAPPATSTCKYKVTTRELLEQAQAVAVSTKSRGSLPEGIRAVLERAISARKRCADWFASSGGDVNSNKKHQHFIETLQNVLDVLRQQPEQAAAGAAGPQSANTLSNKFAALNVEDLDDEFPITALDVATPVARSKGRPTQDVFEIDDTEWEFENAFNLFCFFEDLHAIQDEILSTWKRLAQGQTDLNTATIVTQAGFELVRRLEKETLARTHSCEHHTSRHPHVTLALPPFYVEAFMNGEDPDEILRTPRGLEHRPVDDFLYLPTARTLMKFADITHKAGGRMAWPLPVTPMRFSYISRPELLDEPGYQQLEKDDELLTQLLLDVNLVEEYRPMAEKMSTDKKGVFPPLDDEFTKSASVLWKTGKVHTHAVFVSRVLLDILEVCKGTRNEAVFHRQLTAFSQKANNIMDFRVNQFGRAETGEVRWLSKDTELLMDIHRMIDLHIPNQAIPYLKDMLIDQSDLNNTGFKGGAIEDLPPQVQQVVRERMIERGIDPDDGPTEEHKRNAEKLDIGPIRPSQQKDFFQTHNALHCGALSLRLSLSVEEAGVALANHHMSIFAMAHLYNAFQQLGTTTIKWPDMERIIDLHSGPIFANDVPKTPTEMYRRMCYRTGATRNSKRFDHKQPWKIRTGSATSALKSLLEQKSTTEHALQLLEDQIDEHKSQQEGLQTRNKKSPAGRRRQLTPIHLLRKIEEYVPVVAKDIDLDYITRTKACNALLRQIRATLSDRFGLRFSVISGPGDSYDHGLVNVVLTLLDSCEQTETVHKKRKDGLPFDGGEHMRAANKDFEEFFTTRIAAPRFRIEG